MLSIPRLRGPALERKRSPNGGVGGCLSKNERPFQPVDGRDSSREAQGGTQFSVHPYVTQGGGGESRGTSNSTQYTGSTYSVSPFKGDGYRKHHSLGPLRGGSQRGRRQALRLSSSRQHVFHRETSGSRRSRTTKYSMASLGHSMLFPHTISLCSVGNKHRGLLY